MRNKQNLIIPPYKPIWPPKSLEARTICNKWQSIKLFSLPISCIVYGLLIVLNKVESIKPYTEHQGILAIPSGTLGQIATEDNRIIARLNGEIHTRMPNRSQSKTNKWGILTA